MLGRGGRTLLKLIYAVLFAVLMAAPVFAQDTGASCSVIEDDGERLACYDRVFRTGRPASGENLVTIASVRLIPAAPTGRQPAEMIVTCEAGVLTVQFRFAGHLVSATGDIASVTFQVDQGATTVRSLNVSADNTALGFWTTAESAAFLNLLAGGTNLKVRMTPVRQRSLTVDFRLPERHQAIEAVRSACR